MRRSELRVSQNEAIAGLLDLFVYAEQHWCEWPKLEDVIIATDYDNFSEKYTDWFIEFLANCCFRVWRSIKEDKDYNRVKELETNIFSITNYDWNAFKFAKQNGLDKDVTTKSTIMVNGDKLNEKELKWLRSRCQ